MLFIMSKNNKLLKSFIDRFGITGNVHELYQKTIQEIGEHILGLEINNGQFLEYSIIDSDTTPQYCIQHKKTYWMEFKYTFQGINEEQVSGILFRLPKLVFDKNILYHQGYFIIEGIEKYPMIQSTIAKNIFNFNRDSCSTKLVDNRYTIEIIMEHRNFFMIINNIKVSISNINKQFNIGLDEVRKVFLDTGLETHIIETYITLLTLSNNTDFTYLDDIFREDYFKHLSDEQIVYLVNYMSYLILGCSLNNIPATDISHIGNKIYRTYATSIRNVVIRNIRTDKILDTSAGNIFKKLKNQLITAINTELILKYKTGTINIYGRQYKDMVSTVSRRSNMDTISNVRKICIPTTEESKNKEMRQVHISQYGFICPVETPESSNAGLNMVLSAMSIISYKISEELLMNEIKKWELCDIKIIISINNKIISLYTKDLYSKLYTLKCTDKRFMYMSIYSSPIITINITGDRIMRPVMITDHLNVHRDWDNMYGQIIFIDPMEESNSNISYQEIDECFIVGLSTLSIPFANHNQGARSVFGTSMVKQAIQLYKSNEFVERKEGLYMERPIITTIVDDIIKEEGLYNGINVKVLVAPYLGYNQEDAIVVSQQFVDRIGYICEDIKIIKVLLEPDDVIITTPFSDDTLKYDHGIIKIGTQVNADDMLLAYIRQLSGVYILFEVRSKRDCIIKHINKYQPEGSSQIIYEIITTQYRKLEIGDKMASRHAQKGIITKIIPDHELPIGKDTKFVPDIIINPQYMPSRMTLGQVHESNLAYYAYKNNIPHIDGTIFSKEFKKYLKHYNNLDYMYDPFTKTYSKNKCEIGIVYYYMLTHHSVDKIQHRFYGDNSILTKQPLGGKAKYGGLRVGEMEIDALLAHGASSTIYTVIKNSDMTTANICIECGYILSSTNRCDLCKNHTKTIYVSYAIKNISIALLTYGINLQLTEIDR